MHGDDEISTSSWVGGVWSQNGYVGEGEKNIWREWSRMVSGCMVSMDTVFGKKRSHHRCWSPLVRLSTWSSGSY